MPRVLKLGRKSDPPLVPDARYARQRTTAATWGTGRVPFRLENEISLSTIEDHGLFLAEIENLVQLHLDGRATKDQEAFLDAHKAWWIRSLLRRYDDLDLMIGTLESQEPLPGLANICGDFRGELALVDEVLTTLVGPAEPIAEEPGKPDSTPPIPDSLEPVLQLSWSPGTLVAWAGNVGSAPESIEQVEERLNLADGGNCGWSEFRRIKLPDRVRAESLSASINDSIGWLVAQARSGDRENCGASVTWLGLVAAMAVELVAQGRFVPVVKKSRKDSDSLSTTSVHWAPALVDPDAFTELVDSMPGTAAVVDNRGSGRNMTEAVLGDMVDAICRTATAHVDVPAQPPEIQNRNDFSEALVAALAGAPFRCQPKVGGEVLRRVDQWSKPVVGLAGEPLVITLDPPDENGAWFLSVKAVTDEGGLQPVESALVNSASNKRRMVQDQLSRLERLYPIFMRPGGRRRGEVLLSQEEAWTLMTRFADTLASAGYDLRAPQLSTKKASPTLRLSSETPLDSVVGAQQLTAVSWSVLFDDVELTAADIAELATQARPLVSSKGKWIEIDKVDLAQAAAALAERAEKKTLTGADMLRHALGLDGSPFPGGVSLDGGGWAAELLREAGRVADNVVATPKGFVGELRSYQAEARAWLGFLGAAGLGGCLALDMGLGKTPTMLAHLATMKGNGPALVIAPPAVVGNWAAEAKKFTPGLSVKVHHGPSRVKPAELRPLSRSVDLIITTYGTAVRDMDGLSRIDWSHVVLDEAQAIKNPASETAQQLRRLNATSRIALTGTPIENGLGDLWAIIDFCNPGLVGSRSQFISQLSSKSSGSSTADSALKALNGILVFRRTKAEPAIAAELPDRIDELDHCSMTPEQIGLYQAVLDQLVKDTSATDGTRKKGAVLAAITALKQICNHPVAFRSSESTNPELDGRSGKLDRLNEIVESVFASGERMLIFTHFATWGETLAEYLTKRTGTQVECYHGGLARGARDRMISKFQSSTEAGALVLSLKAGGTGLNLTAANHVVLYDRWWNPAVEDQARDRVWRIGQENTVICHRLVCPGTVDERVEQVVAGKRQIADMVLPKSSSVDDLEADQLQAALGIRPEELLTTEEGVR